MYYQNMNGGFPVNQYNQQYQPHPQQGYIHQNQPIPPSVQYQMMLQQNQEQMHRQQAMHHPQNMQNFQNMQAMQHMQYQQQLQNQYQNQYNNPHMSQQHLMANGMINNNASFGTPINNQPFNPYPNNQPRSSWGQSSQFKQYKPKTQVQQPTYNQPNTYTPPNYNSQQSNQPVNTQQNYTQQPINDSNSQDLVKRIEELEYQNIILMEKLTMLTKLLHKDAAYSYLIGKEEQQYLEEKISTDNNKISYTLYGQDGHSQDQKPEFVVRPYTHKTSTTDGDSKLTFLVDPSDNVSTEINNIVAIGEEISSDILGGNLQHSSDHDLYSHRVKVGQAIVLTGDKNVEENIKQTFLSYLGEDDSEENQTQALKRTSQLVSREIEEQILLPIRLASGFVEKVQAITLIENKIDSGGIKFGSRKLTDAIKYKLRIAYNEFVNNNLGFNKDPLTNLDINEVQQVHAVLSGSDAQVKMSPESVNAYLSGLNNILVDFSDGLKLLQVNIDSNKDDNGCEMNYIIKLIMTSDVYSYVPSDREFVEDIARKTYETHVVTQESHVKLFNIIETIMRHKRDMREFVHNQEINPTMFLSNVYLRISTRNNDICTVFKICKVINNKKPIYIVKPVYHTF